MDPTPEGIFTEIQETFQQQMWKGDVGVDPTPERISLKFNKHFNQQQMWAGVDGVDVDPTSERIFTEIKKHFANKCGK